MEINPPESYNGFYDYDNPFVKNKKKKNSAKDANDLYQPP
jgi:hypothetical protein